ncbi:MAG: hypothetical protein Q9223_001658 [Gallowayella weberi]
MKMVMRVTPVPTISDTNFAIAIRKGDKLFQKLQSGCEPDAVNPVDIDSLRAIGYSIGSDEKSQWPPNFEERSIFSSDQAQRFQWSHMRGYWRTSVDRRYSPYWRDKTKYYNEYSPSNGLIAALAAFRAPHETLHWSDITFALWEATCAFARIRITNIRFIAAHSIQHDFTLSVINTLVENKPGEIRMWGAGTQSFSALLGTPTGARAVYLLMQHKRQLGFKTITKVTLFGKTQAQWLANGPDVVFEVANMVHKIGQEASVNATFLDRPTRRCALFKNADDGEDTQL